MMELLLRNPRQLIPSERFLEKIWGYDSDVELNVVWVYISYLRKADRPSGGYSDQGHPECRIFAGEKAMIQRLRKKFIAASMLALTLVLLVILGGINTMSYYRTVSDADAILTILAQNNGRFPLPHRRHEQCPGGHSSRSKRRQGAADVAGDSL